MEGFFDYLAWFYKQDDSCCLTTEYYKKKGEFAMESEIDIMRGRTIGTLALYQARRETPKSPHLCIVAADWQDLLNIWDTLHNLGEEGDPLAWCKFRWSLFESETAIDWQNPHETQSVRRVSLPYSRFQGVTIRGRLIPLIRSSLVGEQAVA